MTDESFRKLIIQIPCFNEAEILPQTLRDLPRQVPGFDRVEWLVVDDGSTDETVRVARDGGVNHVLSLGYRQGLARAFMAGLEYALKLDADVIVNTDADNQYQARCIPDLIKPILEKRALMVVGARPIRDIEHFSPAKKLLQQVGSWVVRKVSGTNVQDAPSGFRAIHRDAAIQLNVFNDYTYTLETVIQAGRKQIPISSIPVKTNPDLRPSRLITTVPNYIYRSVLTIFRIFTVYNPLRFFLTVAILLSLPAIFFSLRFLAYFLMGEGTGHVQSLVLSGALFALAGVVGMGGVLADLVSVNRLLLEDIRARLLRNEVTLARQVATSEHLEPRAPCLPMNQDR